MAAVIDELVKRDYPCLYGQYYSNGRCFDYGGWYWWGRWVLAGVVVLFAIILLAVIGCISSRRRRKRGLAPMYGTGWMSNGPKYAPNQQNGYQQPYQPYVAPPPAYGQQQPQYTGTTFNPNDGYYGGHNEGVQLQQPQHAYNRDQVYSPPTGPPPGK